MRFPKQSQATNSIKNLLSGRNIRLEPGIVIIGEAEECQVFEYGKKCLAIDTKAQIWIGPKGGDWRSLGECTVSTALQAIDYLCG